MTGRLAELVNETHIRYLYQDSIVQFKSGGSWQIYEPDDPSIFLLDSLTNYRPGTYVMVYRDHQDIAPEWGVVLDSDDTHYLIRKFNYHYATPNTDDVYTTRRFMYVRLMDTEQRQAFVQFLWDNPTIVNVSTP